MSQRLNKDRYAIHGKWIEQDCVDYGQGLPEGVRYFKADLLEKRSGWIWREGAHKVQLPQLQGNFKLKSTTYYGETAWADAARLIGDFDWARRRWEMDHDE